MNLFIKHQKDVEKPEDNFLNLFIDKETLSLQGKNQNGEILEFTKTIEVKPDFSSMGITVNSSDVISGKSFIDSSGVLQQGSLNRSNYLINNNKVTLTSGYTLSKTFEVGNLYTGSKELTPGYKNQTLSANTFLNENIIIKGDANLLPENIKEGISIFDVIGTHQGGSESSANYYKCATVHEAQAGDVCYIISGCPTAEANGTYLPTEYTTEDMVAGNIHPVYSNGTYYYYYEPSNYIRWGISIDYTSSDLLYFVDSRWVGLRQLGNGRWHGFCREYTYFRPSLLGRI